MENASKVNCSSVARAPWLLPEGGALGTTQLQLKVKPRLLRHPKDHWLLLYQGAVYALLIGIFFVFSSAPGWLQVCLFWIGSVLAGRNEAVLHWAVHSPVFRSKRLNKLHRLCFSVVPLPAVLYRSQHLMHHRYDNGYGDDTSTLLPSRAVHREVFTYLLANLVQPGFLPIYRELSANDRRECRRSFALTLALTVVFYLIDPYATLVYWIPVTYVMSFLILLLANYTDHVPGDPGDQYLLATYAELRSPYEWFISVMDMHNSAYHLTHHRLPKIHWAELGRVHEACIPEYKAHGSPVSLAVNSTHLFNPFAFALMLYQVQRRRNTIAVTSAPGS